MDKTLIRAWLLEQTPTPIEAWTHGLVEAYKPSEDDVQDYYDMRRLTPDVEKETALEDARSKFKLSDLSISPIGQVESKHFAPPPPPPPADDPPNKKGLPDL